MYTLVTRLSVLYGEESELMSRVGRGRGRRVGDYM